MIKQMPLFTKTDLAKVTNSVEFQMYNLWLTKINEIIQAVNNHETCLSEFTTKLDDIYNKTSEHLQPTAENGKCANDIPDTEYVTITRDGVFVGGKPATQYLGQDIYNLKKLPLLMVQGSAAMKFEHGVGIAELHCLVSETDGTYAEVGAPSATHGSNAWCQVKFSDGRMSGWVFLSNWDEAFCAQGCANYCALSVQRNGGAYFRASVFSSVCN